MPVKKVRPTLEPFPLTPSPPSTESSSFTSSPPLPGEKDTTTSVHTPEVPPGAESSLFHSRAKQILSLQAEGLSPVSVEPINPLNGKNGGMWLREGQSPLPFGVLKLQEGEIGAKAPGPVQGEASLALLGACEEITVQEGACAHEGLFPGEGPIGEYVANLWLRRLCTCAHISPQLLTIPESVWIRTIRRSNSLPSPTASGCLHEFKPSCCSFAAVPQDTLSTLDVDAVHLLALATCALVNVDAHGNNTLLMGNTIVPIDLACILPRPVGSGENLSIHAGWRGLPQLDRPLSKTLATLFLSSEIRSWLRSILATLAADGTIPIEGFAPERLVVHDIALTIIQEGIRQSLPPRAICLCFTRSSQFEQKAVAWLYPSNQADPSIPIARRVKRLMCEYKKALGECANKQQNAAQTVSSPTQRCADAFELAKERALLHVKTF